MPDKRLAALAGVHPHTIFRERHRRGIAAYQAISPPIMWTEDMIGKLGTATDREVAAELGIKPSSVADKRRNLGIPPFTPPRAVQPGRHWEPEDLARLGQVSDRSLAKELRLSSSTVAHKRQSLGIAPWRPRPPRVEGTEEMIDLLGKLSDLEIARRFSISPSSVKLAREMRGIPPVMDRRGIERTPELLALLELPASEVRRRTGLNFKTIADLKRDLGIQSMRAEQMRYSPEIVARMGKEPDYVIARHLGVSASAVRLKRNQLGIAPFDGHRRRSGR
jgi:hypothetical protein